MSIVDYVLKSQLRIICIYRCFKEAIFSLLATFLIRIYIWQASRKVGTYGSLPASDIHAGGLSQTKQLLRFRMHAMHAFPRPDPNFKTSQVSSLQLKLDWSNWIISASKGKIKKFVKPPVTFKSFRIVWLLSGKSSFSSSILQFNHQSK